MSKELYVVVVEDKIEGLFLCYDRSFRNPFIGDLNEARQLKEMMDERKLDATYTLMKLIEVGE